MVLLMVLTLSFSKAFSVFLMILKALGVLMLPLSLKLTGMMLLSRHLNENLLWFLKSAILFLDSYPFSHVFDTFLSILLAYIEMNVSLSVW